MKTAQKDEEKATRQCWDCLKRRLVCDNTLPHCKKCQKAGRECSGYDEQKPLQWIETGKVTSRRRKKEIHPKVYSVTSSVRECPNQSQADSHACSQGVGEESVLDESQASQEGLIVPSFQDQFKAWDSLVEFQLAYSCFTAENEAEWERLAKQGASKALRELAMKQARSVEHVDNIFQVGSKAKIEEVVSKRHHDEAARMLKSEREPLERLERLLWVMRMLDLPSYDYLSNETSEVVQAVHYYNERIHPDVVEANVLAPNPALLMFPVQVLHVLPPTVHHILVCLTLNHFLHSLPEGSSRKIASVKRAKVYQHRGAAIRALSHYVGQDTTRCNDMTIASVLMFLSVELQNPAYADWRPHASGLQRLIDMRGGFIKLMKSAPYLAPTLIVYVLIVILANTCSPSWDQITISATTDGIIEDVQAVYSLIFPYTLCPPELFSDIMRVNELRLKASASMINCEIDPDHELEAHDLLRRIERFDPEDWAQPGAFVDEWVLIGTIYQAALAIYTTMSLQSLTVLPSTLEMNQMRSVHGDRLNKLLMKAVKCPRVHRFLVWPLVVAGVEAIYRSEAVRYRIGQNLAELSRILGTSSPLKARAVLKRYWKKEEPGWDECFDSPYVFII
ncbi:hypothetical protein ACN47E_008687 [Coniothyrium glycines]